VNTAGAEDSPFIPEGRQEFYFFFTPDPNIPAEKQLLDGVTGIWCVALAGGPVAGTGESLAAGQREAGSGRVHLHVSGNLMYFCSAREGYVGCTLVHGKLRRRQVEELGERRLPFCNSRCGELHIRGDELYYHSS
jgi:hypothetical protein